MSRCWAATTSGSPTMPCCWPGGWSTWSPARPSRADRAARRRGSRAAAEELLERSDVVEGVDRRCRGGRDLTALWSQQAHQLVGGPVDPGAEPVVGGVPEV